MAAFTELGRPGRGQEGSLESQGRFGFLLSLKYAQWEAPEQEKVANVSGLSDSFKQEWETL